MNYQVLRKDNTIYILFYRHAKRVLISTGLKCAPAQWDDKRRKIKLKTNLDYILKGQLDDQLNRVQEIVVKNPRLSNIELKHIIKSKSDVVHGVWDAAELFLRYIKTTGSANRYGRYCLVIKKLKSIDPDLSWGGIDLSLYDKILDWYNVNGYSVNTLGRDITFFKTFFNWCAERGYLDNYSFKSFKSVSQELPIVFLTEQELQMIVDVDLSSDKLIKVRDLFVFMCYTGLRWSDVNTINSSHFVDGMLMKTSVKTKDPYLSIPLVSHALRIAKKYHYDLPRISSQKMSEYLKEIAAKAGIVSPVEILKFKISGVEKKIVPKNELITSKVARKTFVTLSLHKGIPSDVIMGITGHKKYSVLKKYLKITSGLKIAEMKKWE